MDNIELKVIMPIVKEPEIIYPLGWDKDGQAKRRERRKSAKKDKSRWHIKQNK